MMSVRSIRAKRLLLNTSSGIILQAVTIICGFVLPRLILISYGSGVNGLVSSIGQFLSIISLLEFGVGAVVESALYKPLSKNDITKTSQIITSANKFFRIIGFVLFLYVLLLIAFYPQLINDKYDWMFTVLLIIALSITYFSQYFFGIVDGLLLNASQRGYIQNITKTATILVNTFVCVFLMVKGYSIQTVKFSTAIIFLFRPFVYRIYINRNYHINRHEKYKGEPIKQKWNGIAQHIASMILSNTDMVVLTTLSTLENVSIYSVYNQVINGLLLLITSITNGMGPLIGDMWARQEEKKLTEVFGWFEWITHTLTILIYGCCSTLILPFVYVYTAGIDDTEYIQPAFSLILIFANIMHSLRLPYNTMILAAGQYKQTQHNYIISATLNVIVSVISVKKWGLIGVAVGTLIAMAYQTTWMAYYDSINLVKWPLKRYLYQVMVDCVIFMIRFNVMSNIPVEVSSFIEWILLAVLMVSIWIVISTILNLIFFKDQIDRLLMKMKKIGGKL